MDAPPAGYHKVVLPPPRGGSQALCWLARGPRIPHRSPPRGGSATQRAPPKGLVKGRLLPCRGSSLHVSSPCGGVFLGKTDRVQGQNCTIPPPLEGVLSAILPPKRKLTRRDLPRRGGYRGEPSSCEGGYTGPEVAPHVGSKWPVSPYRGEVLCLGEAPVMGRVWPSGSWRVGRVPRPAPPWGG